VLFLNASELLYAGNGNEVLAEADRVVEIIGVGPSLIGVGNLYTAAFASTIQPSVPLFFFVIS
jgi:hypothetical protein